MDGHSEEFCFIYLYYALAVHCTRGLRILGIMVISTRRECARERVRRGAMGGGEGEVTRRWRRG
jgi:hypothetical protein